MTTKRWRAVVELTWDQEPEDIEVKHPGDAPVDFARRAFERVRPALGHIIGEGGAFAHYHVLQRPHVTVELD